MKLSENTSISMPARNLISIIGACIVGAWFGFGVIERLNIIETELQLIKKDLEKANDFIDGVPKGDMVSPQIQELFMLVEFISKNQDKLKKMVESEVPNIKKNDMTIQFHEERIMDLEEKEWVVLMIEIIFAMMLIKDGDKVLEYVPTAGMTDCLQQKRIVSRRIGEEQEGIYVQCKEIKAELEDDMGRLRILRIIE